jgi:hypothetical protein
LQRRASASRLPIAPTQRWLPTTPILRHERAALTISVKPAVWRARNARNPAHVSRRPKQSASAPPTRRVPADRRRSRASQDHHADVRHVLKAADGGPLSAACEIRLRAATVAARETPISHPSFRSCGSRRFESADWSHGRGLPTSPRKRLRDHARFSTSACRREFLYPICPASPQPC